MPELSNDNLVIIKRNPRGEETWRYEGRVVQRARDAVLIEAYFNRDDFIFNSLPLGRGDRFAEAFFATRWYNIFEIHDRGTDEKKGWYCNVTRPAVIAEGLIDYVDLALDLLVYKDGSMLVLDEDEFDALELEKPERLRAQAAAAELMDIFQTHADTPIEDLFALLAADNPPHS